MQIENQSDATPGFTRLQSVQSINHNYGITKLKSRLHSEVLESVNKVCVWHDQQSISDKWMCFWWSDGTSAGPQQFPVLLFDAAVDGVVEAPLWRHEVGDNLSVVDPGQQVEWHLDGQRREEVIELCGRLHRNDNVISAMEQSEWRHSGRD